MRHSDKTNAVANMWPTCHLEMFLVEVTGNSGVHKSCHVGVAVPYFSDCQRVSRVSVVNLNIPEPCCCVSHVLVPAVVHVKLPNKKTNLLWLRCGPYTNRPVCLFTSERQE